MLRFPLLFNRKFQIFKKISFEPNITLRETRLRLKFKSCLHLGHRIFGALLILMYYGVRKYPSQHFLNQSVKVLPQISVLRIWCPSRFLFKRVSVGLLLSQCLYSEAAAQVFLEKSVLKTCSKFTGERPCRSVTSIDLYILL